MRAFFISLIGSFAGKIIATIVIAITAALGFGLAWLAEFLLGIEKPWIVPARIGLIIFAALTLVMLSFSIIRSRPTTGRSTSHSTNYVWRTLSQLVSLRELVWVRIVRLWQIYGPSDYEAPDVAIGIGYPYFPAYTLSQIEFGRRFADAFPGTRGLLTIENTNEIIHRLDVLLRWPLTASPPDKSAEANPIYWTAGQEIFILVVTIATNEALFL